jgi:hypothetical protein
MDASPTLDAPRAGDPITADWAARVADAANAVPHTPQEPGAFASPFGSVPRPVAQPMLGDGDRPLPFDVRVWNGNSDHVDKAYIYLPDMGGGVRQDYVVCDQRSIRFSNEDSMSGPNNGWFCMGAVSAGTAYRIGLAFTPQRGTQTHNWSVFIKSGSWGLPSWGDASMPLVEIARVEIAASWSPTTPYDEQHGVIQFHRGGIVLARQWVRWSLDAAYPNLVFCDAAGNEMFTVADGSKNGYTLSGNWRVNGTISFTSDGGVDFGSGDLKFGSEVYEPQTINIGGTNYKILAKV